MPDLPTVTLPQAHFDRVVAAFPGTTLAEKAAAYQAWLINHLIDRVATVEARRIQQSHAAAAQAEMTAVYASLPAKLPFKDSDATGPAG